MPPVEKNNDDDDGSAVDSTDLETINNNNESENVISNDNADNKEEEHDHDKEERVLRNNNVAGKNASNQRNARDAKHPSSTSTNNLNFDPKEIIQASLWVSGSFFFPLGFLLWCLISSCDEMTSPDRSSSILICLQFALPLQLEKTWWRSARHLGNRGSHPSFMNITKHAIIWKSMKIAWNI